MRTFTIDLPRLCLRTMSDRAMNRCLITIPI